MKSLGQEKMVVVGFGWVGQANALALKKLGYDVSYFDPATPPKHYPEHEDIYKSLSKLTNVIEKDSTSTWYIICVGDRVSEEGVQDISNIQRALDSLKDVTGGIILRSTILPDLLKDLQFDYYVPEFLHEKKAVEECIDPYFFVLGKKGDAKPEPSIFNVWRTRSRKNFEGTPQEASFIKYLSNLWNATRIAFVNEFGDAIGRPSTKQDLDRINSIINFLFDNRSYLRYGKAFGGHCLPKDSRAFTSWYAKKMGALPFLNGMYLANTKHGELEKQYPLMPEWYSEWPNQHLSGRQALRDLLYSIRKYVVAPQLLLKRLFN
ncbi:MAG: GDP-mannose 6-dehydrogenase [Candidatus Parcubacteria bacterium]|jgi:UDPglucose 6-dehydrogenase